MPHYTALLRQRATFALSFFLLALFPLLASAQNAAQPTSNSQPKVTATAVKTTTTTAAADATGTGAADVTAAQDSGSSDLSKKLVWIIPAAVGGAVFLIICILLCCCCMRRRNRRNR